MFPSIAAGLFPVGIQKRFTSVNPSRVFELSVGARENAVR